MHHGGPYPATTAPLHTSVGPASMDRFLRPVCYQAMPDHLLPEALRDGIHWGFPAGSTASRRGSEPVEIVRYVDGTDGPVRVGVRRDRRVHPVAVNLLAELWSRPAGDMRRLLDEADGVGRDVAEVVLLAPVDGRTEVWAAGVTYARSRSARQEESSVAEVYALVYEADRPELFFKSVAWRVVTDGEPVSMRRDSELNVPEAELAVVANGEGEIVGYTVCNDMSSRSIEGENPLYLPQAKIYAAVLCSGHRHQARLGGEGSGGSRHRAHGAPGGGRGLAGEQHHGGHGPDTGRAGGVVVPGTGLPGRGGALHGDRHRPRDDLRAPSGRRGGDRHRPGGDAAQSGGGGKGQRHLAVGPRGWGDGPPHAGRGRPRAIGLTVWSFNPAPSPRPSIRPLSRCRLRPFGRSRMLPRAAYTDPRVFDWEQEHFFGAGWICVGRSEEIAGAGGPASGVGRVGRGSAHPGPDGIAARLCQRLQSPGPRVAAVRCHHPVTAGSSARTTRGPTRLEGEVWTAPGFKDMEGFDAAEHGLDRAPGGRVARPDLRQCLGPAVPLAPVAGHSRSWSPPTRPSACGWPAGHDYMVAANWKILTENYHECYHCGMIHPEFCAVSPPKSGANYHSERRLGRRFMDLRDGAETMSLDGRSGGACCAASTPRACGR